MNVEYWKFEWFGLRPLKQYSDHMLYDRLSKISQIDNPGYKLMNVLGRFHIERCRITWLHEVINFFVYRYKNSGKSIFVKDLSPIFIFELTRTTTVRYELVLRTKLKARAYVGSHLFPVL